MEYKFTYLEEFHHRLKRLPENNQRQILKKIKTVQQIQDQTIFRHIIPLAILIGTATHKLKMGDFRVYFRVTGNIFEAQTVLNQKDAYR